MVKHFHYKRYLFGDTTLGRDITQSDFDLNDRKAMHHGAHQFIPNRRDRAGRPIFVFIYHEITYKEPKNIVRTHKCFSFVIG